MQKNYLKRQTFFKHKEADKRARVDFVNLVKNWVGAPPSFFAVGVITVYQWTLSPDHGIASFYTIGRCKFRPTCSQYTKNSIKEHGVLHGTVVAWRQIKKCH